MSNNSDFENYLNDKLIDSSKFKSSEEDLFNELKVIFDQVHPDSFTAQKLFLINPIRRKYQLDVVAKTTPDKPKKYSNPKSNKACTNHFRRS